MTDNEKLLRQAETFAGARRVLMVINACAYFVWIGAQALYFIDGISVSNKQIALIQMVSGPVWLLSLLGIFFIMFQLKRRSELRGLVDDERTADVTRRAFQVGYWGLLLGVTLVYALRFTGIHLDSAAFLPILLSLGVALPSLTYAFLYRS